jgi:hypothetical protein
MKNVSYVGVEIDDALDTTEKIEAELPCSAHPSTGESAPRRDGTETESALHKVLHHLLRLVRQTCVNEVY